MKTPCDHASLAMAVLEIIVAVIKGGLCGSFFKDLMWLWVPISCWVFHLFIYFCFWEASSHGPKVQSHDHRDAMMAISRGPVVLSLIQPYQKFNQGRPVFKMKPFSFMALVSYWVKLLAWLSISILFSQAYSYCSRFQVGNFPDFNANVKFWTFKMLFVYQMLRC